MLQCAASVTAEGQFYLPMRGGRTGIIDVLDVAEFITVVLTGRGHEGQSYYITGPEILSFSELADQMSAVLGRRIDYVDIPPADFFGQLRKWGKSEWYVRAVAELFDIIAGDGGAQITPTFESVCGKPPRSFRQFVAQNATSFSAQ